MTHMTVWRVRVPEASVAELLAVRDAGIAEAQRLCPELGGRQVASGEAAGILDRHRVVLATHPREEAPAAFPRSRPLEPEADQLDMVVAIGDLYRRDRWAAPAAVWEDLERRFPDLLTSSAAG
ncbi:MAG: hypothetical protein ACFCVG_18870 [Kineosporiaceae bacterium]